MTATAGISRVHLLRNSISLPLPAPLRRQLVPRFFVTGEELMLVTFERQRDGMRRRKEIPEGIGEDVEPGGRGPAPGPLRLVQQFVNTYNHEFEVSRDRLRTAPLARTWLIRHGVLAPTEPTMSERDHRLLLELREGLRAVLMDETAEASRFAALDDAARKARFTIEFNAATRPRLVPTARRVGGAAGKILAAAYEAGVEGTWDRLKACRQCSWIFFDRSKNRSAEWCSMSICGNRVKNRAYRRRQSGKMGRA